jgi:Family of unknown function (DUF6101)
MARMAKATGAPVRDSRSTRLDFETTDPRADERRRRVQLEAHRVTIARRVCGMPMILSIPAESYSGVVLQVSNDAEDGIASLWLQHCDRDLDVPLHETDDLDEAHSKWVEWADFFDLPRLVTTAAGLVDAADRRSHALAIGAAGADRRLSKTVGARRPRFLARRKTGTRATSDRPPHQLMASPDMDCPTTK